MESWLQRLFLISVVAISFPVLAQENDTTEEDRTILDGVINPDMKRRKLDESRIDSEDFEMGFMAGVMSVEDFGSNNSYGVHFNYHISEYWFIEAAYGSTKTSSTSSDLITPLPVIKEEDRDLAYYSMSLGLNLFPGEVFIGKHAFNTRYYVIAGMGNTTFGDDEYFTMNFGGGFKILPADWVAINIGFRNHLFTHDKFGVDKSVQNLEATMGLSLYF